jgi:hypothetical protein
MAFIYVKERLAAVDRETGAIVENSHTRWEIPGVWAKVYSEGELSFEFFVVAIYQNLKTETTDGEKVTRREVAMCIDLKSLRSGINLALRKLGRPPFSESEYSKFLASIKEGVFVQSTWGGWMLERSPNYRVDFIDSIEAKDVNKILRDGEERMR